ncbi:hypothetical protein J0X14_13190 [Muricauda sp. CAU 1633]|uniref:hypothetical protein n=1 Tax=Allomuricauda sp. CAU 1633 TaxID=2816036 RepID=UPI001A8CEA5C|nr:hypothetical protein [Muricauda sp. CAU 1633]MBO0323257.1 hypothetical protein [Muricauda sp. CAU 1633]
MKTRELLTYLEKLEIGLSSFSYEELGTVEAGELKKSFEVFKHGLENKVFGISEMKQLEVIYERIGIQGAEKKSSTSADQTLSALIDALEKTQLSPAQKEIVSELRQVAQNLNMNHTEIDMSSKIRSLEKSLESSFSSNNINLKPVLEDCMGQMELMEELVKLFKQNVLEFIGSAKVHLQNENFNALDLSSQKVQSCLRMMKTDGLLEITQEIIALCRTDNDRKHHAFLYEQFVQEYPKVEEQVDFEMELLRAM